MGHAKEQTLGEFIFEVWCARNYIFSSAFLCVCLGAIILFFSIPQYKAVMVVGPALYMDSASSHTRSSNSVQYSDAVGAFDSTALLLRFMSVYEGAAISEIMLQDKRIIQGLMSDKKIIFQQADEDWNAPKLAHYISKRVVLNQVGESDLYQLHYQHQNPKFAEYFVRFVHGTSDMLIRNLVLKDINGRIDYIRAALSDTVNPELRRSYADMLVEQERALMLVSTSEYFAAHVVEPPYVQARPAWPSYGIFCAFAALIGGVIGYIFYGLRNMQQNQGVDGEALPERHWGWSNTVAENMNNKKDSFSKSDAAE